MTVKQLKQKLEQYPESMDVFVAERKTEFAFGLVNSVRSQLVNFNEDAYDNEVEVLPTETVVIIDEE